MGDINISDIFKEIEQEELQEDIEEEYPDFEYTTDKEVKENEDIYEQYINRLGYR